MTGVPDACPDGGTCHHGCPSEDGDGLPCFRVMAAGPLSGVYVGNQWPADVEAKHHQAYAAEQAREPDRTPLCAAPLDDQRPLLGPKCDRDPHDDADHADTHRRLASCVERWPEAETMAYDPACCRFPKSCSASVTHPEHLTTADVEPEPGRFTATVHVNTDDPNVHMSADGRYVYIVSTEPDPSRNLAVIPEGWRDVGHTTDPPEVGALRPVANGTGVEVYVGDPPQWVPVQSTVEAVLAEFPDDGHRPGCESWRLSSQTDEVRMCGCATDLHAAITAATR